ncbi:DUF1566 domain-containing protein [Rheinheimera oceanensis]|uniref:Lcl C-terminal domain-containing protein n=1 Tax=Rheinheimera oceanensis TaxID=2817449 RepID=UPI001BFDDB04|nr:DUF1566 domain-containing protein [Rheinheimera oceanensis]
MKDKSLKIIFTGALALTLFGCGGSDSGDNGSQETRFTITASAQDGGTITPSTQQVVMGQTANFMLAAASGYRITSVTGCNGSLNGSNYTTGEVIADCSILASFGPESYIVEAQTSQGGSVEPEGLTVQHGDSAEFTVKPELAYQVSDVQGCNGSLAGNIYTTGAIVSDCKISITFTPLAGGAVLGRYFDNNDGTITDPQRKLMWMRCSFGQTWQNENCTGSAAWASSGYALNLTAFYNDGQYSDWRFPTLEELRSLVFCSSGTPSYWLESDFASQCTGNSSSPTIVGNVFPSTHAGANTYITSTAEGTGSGRLFYHVSFANGVVHGPNQAHGIHWRLVRNTD